MPLRFLFTVPFTVRFYCSVYCSVLLFRFVRNSLTVNNSTVPFTVRFYCSVYCSVLLFRLLFRFVRNSLTVNNSTVPFTVRFYCSLLHRSQLYPKGVILRRFKRFYIRCSVAVHRKEESVLESVFGALSLIYHIINQYAPITLNPYDAHICVLRR